MALKLWLLRLKFVSVCLFIDLFYFRWQMKTASHYRQFFCHSAQDSFAVTISLWKMAPWSSPTWLVQLVMQIFLCRLHRVWKPSGIKYTNAYIIVAAWEITFPSISDWGKAKLKKSRNPFDIQLKMSLTTHVFLSCRAQDNTFSVRC